MVSVHHIQLTKKYKEPITNIAAQAKNMIKNAESWSILSTFKNAAHETVSESQQWTRCQHHHRWPQSTDLTHVNTRPYQLSPSPKLLPTSTKGHSILILYISNVKNFILTILVVFSFHRLIRGSYCFYCSRVLPYIILTQFFSNLVHL